MGLMRLFDRTRRSDRTRVDPVVDAVPVDDPDDGAFSSLDDLVPVTRRIVRHRFAEHLISMNLVQRDVMESCQREAAVTKERIGDVLVRNSYLRRSDLVDILATYDPQSLADGQMTRVRIPAYELRRHSTVVSAETEERLFVSTMLDEDEVEALVKPYYPDKQIVYTGFNPEKAAEFFERISMADVPGEDEVVPDHQKLTRLILMPALYEKASDIHILPRHATYSVFVRYLGDLRHIHEGNLDEYGVVITQIKSRSNIDTNERRVGQDGQMSIEFESKAVDMRVATLPTIHGEACVIRILDGDRVDPKLDKLGITGLPMWRDGTSRKSGLCIITGEVGSGKTTTLRATLTEFNRLKRRIWTVEDPVEYKLPFVGQVAINHHVGLDFKTVLKHFMRSDGDVLVIGEIRDEETARNAIRAAQTGCLVLATLHNDSVISSISRLHSLGIQSHELRYVLRAVLVQTLVRCICSACKGEGEIDGAICPKCLGSGYDRQTVASECQYFQDQEAVDHVIALAENKANAEGIRWTTMLDDAIGKMRQGLTTFDELFSIWGVEVVERCRVLEIDVERHRIRADR